MRHGKHRHSLGVTKEHRAAMLSNMGASLIVHGRITTTLSKAKALRPFVEKIITKAKKAAGFPKDEQGRLQKDALHQRRVAARKLRSREAIRILFDEKVAQFLDRPGGYTRIYKLSPRRIGDAAPMALIELVAPVNESVLNKL